MIRKIVEQVVTVLSTVEASTAEDREQALRMATAVLMVDVARADHDFDETEFNNLLGLIEQHFDVPAEQAAALINEADEIAEDMVSLHEFTQRLHQELDEEEKARIIGMLWQVAYADGRLDRYENALVLKISDLLYVNRARVMRLKYDTGERHATGPGGDLGW
jgi:uncharacterized tellurite resistance protein B-like protein